MQSSASRACHPLRQRVPSQLCVSSGLALFPCRAPALLRERENVTPPESEGQRAPAHSASPACTAGRAAQGGGASFSGQPNDGYFLVARSLARLGVKEMFGVIGIPVTQLASGA